MAQVPALGHTTNPRSRRKIHKPPSSPLPFPHLSHAKLSRRASRYQHKPSAEQKSPSLNSLTFQTASHTWIPSTSMGSTRSPSTRLWPISSHTLSRRTMICLSCRCSMTRSRRAIGRDRPRSCQLREGASRGELKKKSVALTGRKSGLQLTTARDDLLSSDDWTDMQDVANRLSIESRADNFIATGRAQNLAKKDLTCTWDGCPYFPPLELERTRHLDSHAKTAIAAWRRDSLCVWPGCKSKAIFKCSRSYSSHLMNIHTKPLLCTVPSCKHKKPFRNLDDLRRHKSTAHSSLRPYVCPFANCPEVIKSFARKDKWLKHIRETPHEGDGICPYYHCTSQMTLNSTNFQTREEISKHFAKLHSGDESTQYICRVGACALHLQLEHWTIEGLADHLKTCHEITSNIGLGLRWHDHAAYQAQQEGTVRVLRDKHLQASYFSYKWHDCTICAQPQPQQGLQTDYIAFQPLAFNLAPNNVTAGMTS